MKEYKTKDGAILIGILAVGSILITGFCEYLFETIKNKKTKTGERKKKIDDLTIDLQDAPPLRMNRRSTVVS
jgi:flagellar basal body-associated protein FliL